MLAYEEAPMNDERGKNARERRDADEKLDRKRSEKEVCVYISPTHT